MSTDRKKKNRRVPRIERIKVIEYVCIGLVILLFLGLAIFYGGNQNRNAAPEAEVSPSPVPTDDPSIRGKNVLDAIEDSSFALTFSQDRYDLVSESGVSFEMRMLSDDNGITELSVGTLLCPDPDPEDTSELAAALRSENKESLNALRELFDLIMPVFHRTAADSDTIVSQCAKVVKTGESYSKHIGRFTLRILSDPEQIPQTVTIKLIRDP